MAQISGVMLKKSAFLASSIYDYSEITKKSASLSYHYAEIVSTEQKIRFFDLSLC
jgi:hypothetical protein